MKINLPISPEGVLEGGLPPVSPSFRRSIRDEQFVTDFSSGRRKGGRREGSKERKEEGEREREEEGKVNKKSSL